MDPSSVTKLRLRGKAKGLDHDRARQHLRRQGRETEQTGVRNRKPAPGAKCWDCEQGSAAEFGGSGNLCNPRPVRMPSCAQIQCLSLVSSPHVSPQPCRVYSALTPRLVMTTSGSACSAIENAAERVREQVLERVKSQKCLQCTCILVTK